MTIDPPSPAVPLLRRVVEFLRHAVFEYHGDHVAAQELTDACDAALASFAGGPAPAELNKSSDHLHESRSPDGDGPGSSRHLPTSEGQAGNALVNLERGNQGIDGAGLEPADSLSIPSDEGRPQLVWEGPDDDGDLIVTLTGFPKIAFGAHGKTREEALMLLGDQLHLTLCETCLPPDEGRLREALEEAIAEVESDNAHTLECCASEECICGRDARVARWKAALLASGSPEPTTPSSVSETP